MKLDWIRTRKDNGSYIYLRSRYIIEEVQKYLDTLGHPWGIFIGDFPFNLYPMLIIMDGYKNKSAAIKRIEEIHNEYEIGLIAHRLDKAIKSKVLKELEKLPEEERTEEKIQEIVEKIL